MTTLPDSNSERIAYFNDLNEEFKNQQLEADVTLLEELIPTFDLENGTVDKVASLIVGCFPSVEVIFIF
jgi:hypothetical protein